MFAELTDCMMAGEQEKEGRFLLNLLMIRKVNIDFSMIYESLKAGAEGQEEEEENYRMYRVPFLSKELRWGSLRERDGVSERRLYLALREIGLQDGNYRSVLDQDKAWVKVSRRLRETAYDIFTAISATDKNMTNQNGMEIAEMYEFVMSRFVSAPKGMDEFYSSREISQMMLRLLRPESGIIYDPCCGSGSLLVAAACRAGKERKGFQMYGQEASPEAWAMANMNFLLRDMDVNMGGRAENVFVTDLHPGLKADYILGNPPFRSGDWSQEGYELDPRWEYGIPPRKKSTFAWVQHMLYHLKDIGKMTVILSSGSLEGGSRAEQNIRRKMIEDDIISAIILLPAGLFYHTRVITALWFVEKRKDSACRDKIFFMDCRNMGRTEGKTVRLSEEEVRMICSFWELYQAGVYEWLPGICAVADREEIRRKDFSLYPDRYIRKSGESLPAYGELKQEERQCLKRLSELAGENRSIEAEMEKGLERIRNEWD